MKILAVILCAVLLAGCAGRHPKGTARYDDYDAVKVEQMVGNNVSGRVFERTIVCLNARREIRRVTALTNTLVTAVTNQTIVGVTNHTVSIATNFLFTSMTNLAAAIPLTPIQPVGDAPADTNTAASVGNAALSTNLTVSVANNNSGTVSPSQRASNHQQVRTYNNQLTTTTNNLSVSLVTNIVVTAETNQTVSYVTNTSVVSATNAIITPTNGLAFDYFLYTEMIPPPDFALAQGESLILLVDGVRHGFTQGQSGTAFVARRGYTSGLYRVPPEVLVAIANAKEVKLRFKGVNNVVERNMSNGSRQRFREFVAKYFAPSATPETKKMAALEETTRNNKR
jgi:hypothetical protein